MTLLVSSLFPRGRPAALLFDLDGTLVDSVPDLAGAIDHMLAALGYESAGEERVRGWVGNGAAKLVERALTYATGKGSVDAGITQQAMTLFLDEYRQHCCASSQLYPGVRDALHYWQSEGIPMACVTNKPYQLTTVVLEGFELSGLFPVVVGGDTLVQKKPDAAPLLYACEQLQVEVGDCLMIGDSVNDVEAARHAGMPVACVSYGYNHGEPIASAKPDLLVDNLMQLIND